MEVIIAPQAQRDIVGILVWTQEQFGPLTMQRYALLIQTAIEDIAADPKVLGSEGRPEISDHCRTYHLFYSRKKAGKRNGKIRTPRHFLVYRVTEAEIVEIGRVLHDSMDLEQHLPEEYRRRAE